MTTRPASKQIDERQPVSDEALNDDIDLLRRCQQGDKTALDDLLRRYQDPIYRLALRTTGSSTVAQDATAAALVKIWTKSKQWRGDASAATWIYRLAYRTILDTQRSQQRWWKRWILGLSPQMSDGKPSPEELASGAEEKENLADRIAEALQQLSPDDRALVHLYYFEQRSLGDIEEIIDASRGALKMRLSRARDKLRVLLEDLGDFA